MKITVFGEEHELLLNLRASKEITQKYGGLEEFGELFEGKSIEETIDDVIWIVTLLAKQGADVHNLQHPDSPREYLSAEAIELAPLATLFELRDAIGGAMMRGSARHVQSQAAEGDEKNTQAG